VALAAALVVPAGVAVLGGMALGTTVVLTWAIGACVAVLPVAIGAAILRYRLYDLDRIISRTLAYGVLTVLLGGGYAGVVLGLGQLLGRQSSLVVAGATLALAALFQPARRSIQRAVDRRFNRRRYDTAQTITGFSARLRQQIDLDTLTTELLAVVHQTMRPTQVSLWLRPTTGPQSGSNTASSAQRSGNSRTATLGCVGQTTNRRRCGRTGRHPDAGNRRFDQEHPNPTSTRKRHSLKRPSGSVTLPGM
jgi:hypothetical protein